MRFPLRLQDIPPAQARFCLGIERFLRDELKAETDGAAILVAFSGGVDSTVLLATLALLRDRLRCEVLAAHLDHGLRQESSAEARHALALCEAAHIHCETTRIDVAALAATRGIGLEEAARDARYDFLEQTRQRNGASLIALGHNLDDLAEDVLMRLTRGAGWPELGGMRGIDSARHLVRPLLLTTRADIETCARALGLPWVEDASNADTTFTRNRMRHEVLPLLARENPNILRAVAAQWRVASLDRDYWDGEVQRLLECGVPHSGGLLLPREILDDLHQTVRLRLYKATLERLGPGQALADSLHTLDRLFRSGEGGRTVQFPGAKTVTTSAAGLLFRPREC
ncbi:tRNA(Ile)-lysidine synthase [Desulfobaculum xiamenense]|uniref:tRNA(Ile)-lysidine synthase n=1 Tax=Desulfobaculum xiamenense TaxID=995050 RepID=A0A846QMX6_9BACT|nr:tRNA lysidine(34) synthetase TilS [Desulfobaculum xiamenense]NJB66775.1 tRNA(Ile)-lysidine synthase [Desulfobaculum xiamenense]